jgi:hypothetical protein
VKQSLYDMIMGTYVVTGNPVVATENVIIPQPVHGIKKPFFPVGEYLAGLARVYGLADRHATIPGHRHVSYDLLARGARDVKHARDHMISAIGLFAFLAFLRPWRPWREFRATCD